MQTREQEIIDAIDAYCQATGLAPATVGTRAHQETYIYERLKQGGSCGAKAHKKIMKWFKDNWPHNSTNPKFKKLRSH